MTQARTGAIFPKGRLPSPAALSALALSALAGGVALSGGQAQADSCTPITPGGNSCTIQDYFGTATIKLTIDPPNGNGGLVGTNNHSHLSFHSSGLPFLLPLPGSTLYIDSFDESSITGDGYFKLETTGPAWFYLVTLQVLPRAIPNGQFPTSGFEVTTSICDAIFVSGVCSGNPLGSMSVNDYITREPTWPQIRTRTLYVKNSVSSAPGNIGVRHFNNGFYLSPGPLPILGVGTAFGFSRKLRSRIKAARTA